MLHIVKTVQAIEEAVQVYSNSDQLILIEEAVYAANPQHNTYPLIQGLNIAVLQADVEARGVANRVSPSAVIVDYSGFVNLTAQQPKSITWQ